MHEEAQPLITTLETNRFYARCPCDHTILLRNASLFYLDDFTPTARAALATRQKELREDKASIKKAPAIISDKSQKQARSVNRGLIFERIVTTFQDFPFSSNDCRSLFDPIDYVVFHGLSATGIVDKIFWLEIKTGGAQLNSRERQIRQLVQDKKLTWDLYTMDKNDGQ